MDERFNEIISKMETLISKSNEWNKKLSDSFSDISKAQSELENKIKKINEELNKSKKSFEEDGRELFNKIREKQQKKVSELSDIQKEFKKSSKEFLEKHKKKVDELIASINNKSSEILTIFDELENIKEIQAEAKQNMQNIKDENSKLVKEFSDKLNAVLEKDIISDLRKLVKSNKMKIKKLERHAHRHIIGGKSV